MEHPPGFARKIWGDRGNQENPGVRSAPGENWATGGNNDDENVDDDDDHDDHDADDDDDHDRDDDDNDDDNDDNNGDDNDVDVMFACACHTTVLRTTPVTRNPGTFRSAFQKKQLGEHRGKQIAA
eukprot:gene9685-biopygen18232